MTCRVFIGAALASLALAGCSDPYAGQRPFQATTAPTEPTSPALTYSRAFLNRQDRTTASQRRREQLAMTQRPLLNHLPLSVGDAAISIYGLAPDDRHTVLQITAPTKALGQRAYHAALRAYSDSGTAYQPRFTIR